MLDDYFDLRNPLSVGWTRAARQVPETCTRGFQVLGRIGVGLGFDVSGHGLHGTGEGAGCGRAGLGSSAGRWGGGVGGLSCFWSSSVQRVEDFMWFRSGLGSMWVRLDCVASGSWGRSG